MTRAFVYGTLKRGHRAHHHIEKQTFLEAAVTAAGYRLFNIGEFPGLVRDETGGSIQGELWTLDAAALAVLDDYEGVAEGIYERALIDLNDGTQAETFFYLRPTLGLTDCGAEWSIVQEQSASPPAG